MASFLVTCPRFSSSSSSSSFPQCNGCSNCSRGGTTALNQHHQPNKISFHLRLDSGTPSLVSRSSLNDPTMAVSLFQSPYRKQAAFWRLHAQLNEVAAEISSNCAPIPETKSGAASSEGKDESSEELPDPNTIPHASSISAFMSTVSDLVKIVDSRDIMELQLKQLDCELIIRKKEALQQPPPAAPVFTMQSPLSQSVLPSQPPLAEVTAPTSASPSPSASVPTLPAPGKSSKSSHPPMKCPMAGTFYRCPAPGEPPFVKVGDKVQKGQVICIIEAMKLMNEIEADQSGTLAEILVDDGKPVSMDTPLFAIVP